MNEKYKLTVPVSLYFLKGPFSPSYPARRLIRAKTVVLGLQGHSAVLGQRSLPSFHDGVTKLKHLVQVMAGIC